jgi:hypothetical protein
MVLTDPPYYLDGLDTDWRKGQADSVRGTGMDDRLTDEKWREMLEQGEVPERPAWISSFYAE